MRFVFDARPKSLLDFQTVIDFGSALVGSPDMFKDFRGTYYDADVDHKLVDWAASTLPWVTWSSDHTASTAALRQRAM
jgi:hypothetical protein